MKYFKIINNFKGFTLIELLVVVVIMGLVMTSVFGLFTSSNRTANTSEEVVDVQQNLRVAMETLVSDIRMAGFLIPTGDTAITSAPDIFGIDNDGDDVLDTGAIFSLNTISASRTYARVLSEDTTAPSGLIVEADMADLFGNGNVIRVIRPSTKNDITGELTISSDPTVDKLPISSYVSGTVQADDMVVLKLVGEPDVATISYWLRKNVNDGANIFDLVRNDGTATSVVASNISSLDLTYLFDDGTESTTTTAFDQIRAIRVDISTETDNTKTGLANYSGVKQRSLKTVTKIQNSLGG